ncbi:MAG: hypothetical protein H6755_03850 [Candidatus Omnitrophica bacterium]|nr:hypothetical protein [Candidatus Omnitrophota bacterium]
MNKEILKKILFVIGLIFLVFLISKNFIIKTVITKVGSSTLGAQVQVRKFSLSILTQKVSMKDVRIYNPPGFGNDELIEMPEITIKCNLWAMAAGKMHIPLAVINLKKMVVVKNKDGQLNVDALKVVKDSQKAEEISRPEPDIIEPEQEEKEKEVFPESPVEEIVSYEEVLDKKSSKKPLLPPLQIDELRLNVEQVVYKDYSKGENPTILVYDVDLKNKEFKNINSISKLVTIVLINAMGPTAIRSAGIYAAGALMGVGFLPAGVFGVIVGKDNATAEFDMKYRKVFKEVERIFQEIGSIKKIDHERKAISAKINGYDVKVWFEEVSSKKTKLNVTARKYLMPKSKVAGGILYQITERLK